MTGSAPTSFAEVRPIVAKRTSQAPLPPPPATTPLSAVRPAGCELLVRNVNPLPDRNAAQIVQASIDDILKRADAEHGKFHLVPVTAMPASSNRSKTNDLASASVIVKIDKNELEKRDASVARQAGTRSDLLEAWIAPLSAANAEWQVLPAPGPDGRDKRCWVIAAPCDDPDRLLKEMKLELSKRNIPVVHDFKMQNQASVIILRSPAAADDVRKIGLKVPSCPDGVRLQAANQIDPIHVFETVIRSAGDLDYQSQESILSFLEHTYRSPSLPADQSCILETRTVGDDLCVTFCDWDTTARALSDRDGFMTFCANARNVEPVTLIFDANSPQGGPRSRPMASRFNTAASSVGGAINGIHAELVSLKKQVASQQSSIQEQFAELRKANADVVTAMTQIEAMTKRSMLLSATTSEAFLARGRADLLERRRIELRDDIKDATDPAIMQELQRELNLVLSELKTAREAARSLESAQLEMLPTMKLAITGSPSSPPAPSSTPATPSGRKRSQAQALLTPAPTPTKSRTLAAGAVSNASPPPPPPDFASTRNNSTAMDVDDTGGL